MVLLQESLKNLKTDLWNEKEETRIAERQALEAHKQVLLQVKRQQDLEAALAQRDAEVAGLRAKLSQRVSTCTHACTCCCEADWQSQTPPKLESCT